MDEAGGDFSLPKLAKRIGVSQSSIYNHVSGREEILELMRGRIISESPYVLEDEQDWEASLRAIVRSYRDAFARHPKLAPLLVLQTVQDAQVMALYENLAVALEAAGFRGRDVMSAISTIDSFALGFALDLAAPDVVWAPPAQGYPPALTSALAHAGPPVSEARQLSTSDSRYSSPACIPVFSRQCCEGRAKLVGSGGPRLHRHAHHRRAPTGPAGHPRMRRRPEHPSRNLEVVRPLRHFCP